MKRSRKIILLILVAACFVILYVSLVRPEMKYRQALQKYKPGVTAETIEHDYGVHLDLRSSGNILPYAPPDQKKPSHPSLLLSPEAALTADEAMQTMKAQRMERLGLAKFVNRDRDVWRHTLKGAWLQYYRGFRTQLAEGKMQRDRITLKRPGQN